MAQVSDPLLPALEHLLGPGAGSLLAAVAGAAGGTVERYERRQVLYRPGDRAAVRYAVRIRWSTGALADETVVAVTTAEGPPDGTLVLTAGDLSVGLFRYPHDPSLPGLPVATVPDRLEGWLALGSEPDLRVRSYRPTRRAVVHARWGRDEESGGSRELYVKCVPPAEVAGIHDWLTTLRGYAPVPVPAVLDRERGLLALEALPGRTIREVLRMGDEAALDRLPDGADILDLLEGLPAPTPAMPSSREGPIERVAAHADLLAAVLPDLGPRLVALLRAVGTEPDDGPEVLSHGDLYEAQILVDEGGVSGLLDLDGAGRGTRRDDLATFLAHLVVLAEVVPDRRPAIDRYRTRLQSPFESMVGRSGLARATGAAIVGLATGPFRVQQAGWPRLVEARLGLAEAWVASARRDGLPARSAESILTDRSPSAQAAMR